MNKLREKSKPGTERKYLQTAYKTEDSHLEYLKMFQRFNMKKQNLKRKMAT